MGRRVRSPVFPSLSLEQAIQRTRTLYQEEGVNSVPWSVLAKHWNYSVNSSGLRQAASALREFGLIETTGTGANRAVRLTETAEKIVGDDRAHSPDRDSYIREAALVPRQFRAVWDKWETDLPSQETLKYQLKFNWKPKFNPKSVNIFVENYLQTLKFARYMGDEDSDSSDTDCPAPQDSPGDERELPVEGEQTSTPSTSTSKPTLSGTGLKFAHANFNVSLSVEVEAKDIDLLISFLEVVKKSLSKPEVDSLEDPNSVTPS